MEIRISEIVAVGKVAEFGYEIVENKRTVHIHIRSVFLDDERYDIHILSAGVRFGL